MVRERGKIRTYRSVFLIPPPGDGTESAREWPFNNGNPLEVDIGCGRGRFLLAKARANPETNYLGIDRSLLRLRKIDTKAQAAGLANIRLVHGDAMWCLDCLHPGSVAAFYLFFPDPWPKRRHHSKRLVSAAFVASVTRTLAPAGIIHLCTDHADYYAFMLKCWDGCTHFTPVTPFLPAADEETDFALIFNSQNLPTYRCSYQKLRLADRLQSSQHIERGHLAEASIGS